MPSHGRSALALIALVLATPVFASDPLPPELSALKAKAENGNAIAQYNLGLAYASGNGVPLDQAEAFVWLTLASEQGSTGKDLGILVSGMSQEMLAEGKRRLAAERSQIAVPVPSSPQVVAQPQKRRLPQSRRNQNSPPLPFPWKPLHQHRIRRPPN